MKLDAPWRCDKCNRLKEPTNGWLVGHYPAPDSFSIWQWNEELAEKELSVHLCGVECGQKWTTEQMGKLVNRN
jgi:hypothetical protein